MESDLWRDMRDKILRSEPQAHLQRIENLCGSGIPDVNGCIRRRDFFVELKFIHEWPKTDIVVRFPKYRKEQRIWFRRRGEAGATNIFLLLQVGEPREYLLFDWKAAVYQVGFTTKEILRKQALLAFEGSFPVSLIVANLRQEVNDGQGIAPQLAVS